MTGNSDAERDEAREALKRMRAIPVYAQGRPIGRAAAKSVAKKVPKRAASVLRLRASWADIVGKELAGWCWPKAIRGGRAGSSLTVECIPAAAPLVQHREHQLRQRVSVWSGRPVVKLSIVMAPPREPEAPALPVPEPSPEAVRDVHDAAARVSDPELRDAIVRLGLAMLAKEQDTGAGNSLPSGPAVMRFEDI